MIISLPFQYCQYGIIWECSVQIRSYLNLATNNVIEISRVYIKRLAVLNIEVEDDICDREIAVLASALVVAKYLVADLDLVNRHFAVISLDGRVAAESVG
jgi:hypothetical protein